MRSERAADRRVLTCTSTRGLRRDTRRIDRMRLRPFIQGATSTRIDACARDNGTTDGAVRRRESLFSERIRADVSACNESAMRSRFLVSARYPLGGAAKRFRIKGRPITIAAR